MPITGPTRKKAMRAFVDVLNRLLSTTVTQRRLVSLEVGDVRAAISFRRAGSATDVPLKSDFGRLHLYLGQYCETVPSDGGGFQVVTVAYAYHLRAEGAEEPTFRWEYERDPIDPDARYCRHHLQGSVPLEIGGRELSMNDIHLPTGWVTVEEVLRFCIAELGVKPLKKNWHEILTTSYGMFKTIYSPMGDV